MPTLEQILSPIQDKLQAVEREFQENLLSQVSPLDTLGRRIRESGGKRVRPATLLLCSRLAGYQGESDVTFASTIEFVHTATLLHDDVIDQAETRRGRRTLNLEWGNQMVVLLGDYLYTKAMLMALEEDTLEAIRVLCRSTMRMIEGELLQLANRGRIDQDEALHLDIVRRKTAMLFSGCGELASMVTGLDPKQTQALKAFGENLGMAFQLTDDLLDFEGTEETVGKPVVKDITEGKLTLPLIYLLERDGQASRTMIQTVLEEEGFHSVRKEDLLELIAAHQTLDMTRTKAQEYALSAKESLSTFPDSSARQSLMDLTDYVLERRS